MKKFFLMFSVAVLFSFTACNSDRDAGNSTNTDATNVAINNIMQRKSVRAYTEQTVGDDTIEAILRAAMAAPSAVDVRPWRFVVLKDKSRYDSVFEGNFNMDKFKQSAFVIVVCADTICLKRGTTTGEVEPNKMWRDDMGAATENLLLAVEAYGLGAVWTSCYPHADRMTSVKVELGLPAEVVPYAIVPVGHPAGETQVKDKWKKENIHYERW